MGSNVCVVPGVKVTLRIGQRSVAVMWLMVVLRMLLTLALVLSSILLTLTPVAVAAVI